VVRPNADPLRFATIPDDGRRLRLVQVGAGQMGEHWLTTIAGYTDVELVGLVDLNVDAARAAAEAHGLDITVGSDVVDVARQSGAQAVINVTIPAAHHPVTTAALFAGLPVLGEKPVAVDVAEALSLAAAAEITNQLFMVSQSRRYFSTLWQYKAQLDALGPVSILTTEFFKAAHFPGFREEMDHPLLLDMAIHQFDAARFLLDDDPVAVYCEEYNPPWSWYRGNAGATAVFEMASGARYIYTGSWVSPGQETSWNGSWRASGEHGSALWDGDDRPTADVLNGPSLDVGTAPIPRGEELAGALREFVDALRTGDVPSGEVHANLLSLAMVEAALSSATTGKRVMIDDLMIRARQKAQANERNTEVAARLVLM